MDIRDTNNNKRQWQGKSQELNFIFDNIDFVNLDFALCIQQYHYYYFFFVGKNIKIVNLDIFCFPREELQDLASVLRQINGDINVLRKLLEKRGITLNSTASWFRRRWSKPRTTYFTHIGWIIFRVLKEYRKP